ncbi:hypothetical protein ANOBCDAF_00188 [Pleomorphomonas sp. T1.2MG-36]|uniref:hypothetical protein n=1 Tax=Pleomorphomonas sp. T1.2MG-36 TaxID=3041167 RepID=UPI002477AC28|nr:hypothetical protein [Pleomorphomonas sp. T1.2MG-36]CAI9399037.1 hypothetical protein ANOBCDAF_00188 [Pleomorphomonas sp. T1.2MG-36]
MKTGYIIEAGVVVNAIVLDDDADPIEFGAVLGPEGVGIGWTVDGESWAPQAGPSVPLEDLRGSAKAAVDASAEAYRLTYITPGAGQAMAYQQKLTEAKAYLADASLTAAECPHIFAEVGITGATAEAVARVVTEMHAAWQIKSAEIERLRLEAKAAIDAAESAEAISAAAVIVWPE